MAQAAIDDVLPVSGGASSAGRRRRTLAIVTDWAGNNYYADPIVDEATRTAHEHDADVVWLVDRPSSADLSGGVPLMFDVVRREQVDAVLIVSFGHAADPASVAAYCERFRPLPVCTLTTSIPSCARVLVENGPGMRDAVLHLIDAHARRRIAFVRGPASSSEAEARYAAYAQALADRGMTVDPELVVSGDFGLYSGLTAARELLDRGGDLDAIVSANDGMAIAALQELTARGIRVPEDVALVGFDDSDVARAVNPPLTTVRQPTRRQARLATELLFAELDGHDVARESAVGTELVLRRSCGCSEAVELDRSTRGSAPPPDGAGARIEHWARTFSAALDADIRGPTSTALLTKVKEVAAQALEDGGVSGMHRALSVARKYRLVARGPDADARGVDHLIERARIAIGIAAEEAQASQRLRTEEQTRRLGDVNRALTAAVSIEALTDALAPQLAWLSIPSLYLCLSEPGDGASRATRLVLAVKDGRRLPLPEGGQPFAAGTMLPSEYLPAERHSTHICCAFDRKFACEGYVVFERGQVNGMIYDAVAEQIGAAIRRVHTLERLVEEARRREAAERERLEKEMHLARHIQTGILPRTLSVEGLEISAVMLPASEVGGDYYDVLPSASCCWFGIGDVAGHGLPAGLVMMMLQSVVSGLVHSNPDQTPRGLLGVANRVLFENVRERMRQKEHMTLTLLRYAGAGEFSCAGAHEDILICRAGTGAIEWVETPGTWVGIVPDIDAATEDSAFRLDAGDVMLLYSDGATEARNEHGELFGPERIAAIVHAARHEPVTAIRDALFEAVKAWMTTQEDDITLVVLRRVPC